ncbi:MAG: universal stress protein [Mycobacteriales bacterium]
MSATGGSQVVVGVDGSVASGAAVRWAAMEAAIHHAPLTLCHSWSPDTAGEGGVAAAARAGHEVLQAASRAAAEVAPTVESRTVLSTDPAHTLLVALSHEASLVAVGLGPLTAEVVVGSVAPVVVLPGGEQPYAPYGRQEPTGPVVVSVEDDADRIALEFALAEADQRRTGLIAVYVNAGVPAAHHYAAGTAAVPDGLGDARRHLDGMLDPWQARYPQVPVQRVLDRPPMVPSLLRNRGALLVMNGAGNRPWLAPAASALLRRATGPVAFAR